MNFNNQLAKHRNNQIKTFIVNIFHKIKGKNVSSNLVDKNMMAIINTKFPNKLEQDEVKNYLEDLLSRNNRLMETLDIKMLHKDIISLFSKSTLERIVTDDMLQMDILELSQEDLQTYAYILNYEVTDINERIGNLFPVNCKDININELQKLNDNDRLKAIIIILSNSEFRLRNLNELDNYYEKRKNMCKQIINQPDIIKQEYDKNLISKDEISLLDKMKKLSDLDIIKYAIMEAKYGISLKKAKVLCSMFAKDIDNIEKSEETRIINELKSILGEDDISQLRKIDLDEDFNNYIGTMNIIPNLKNAYTHQYQETLYQIKEEDYIGSQSIKLKGKKRTPIKIYNALGKDNDKADFNMMLSSYSTDKNYTIPCSYIGNDFLGVVDDDTLVAFSDIRENELHNDDRTLDVPFYHWEDLSESEFLSPQNQLDSSKVYNKLWLEKKVEKGGNLENRKPTYAVFMAETLADIQDAKNKRWNDTKRLAGELDIPIVVVDQTQCAKLEYDKVREMIELLKKEKRMDFIPTIIHKMENNKSAPKGIGAEIRNSIFSETNIKKCLEEIVRTIITSPDIGIYNQGIEQFVKTTKELKNTYKQHKDKQQYLKEDIYNSRYRRQQLEFEECKSYDYDAYINRLKILYTSRNKLDGEGNMTAKGQDIIEKQPLENDYGEIDFYNQ